jgi:hypothetical protein
MLRPPAWLALAPALALAVVVAGASCGSSATGVGACKSIEEARCKQVPNCPNVQVSPPLWFTTGSAVDACIRYYDTACLHGLAIGTDPGTSNLNACVAAINDKGCGVVAAPQSDPSCAWLVPPAEQEAGEDADSSEADAASDGD